MLNPVFWCVILITLVFSFYSLSNWKLGLLIFFIYTQFFGIVKRIILFIGLDNFAYNVLVVIQYVFLLSIIIGAVTSSSNQVRSNGKVAVWLSLFSLILLASILVSPYGIGISATIATIQYFPIFIILAGQYLEPRQMEDIKSMLIKTAPIHALYQVYQSFFGPFGFELSFVDTKYSMTNAVDGDFIRGIPLYDSVDPLYLHFALVFLLLLQRRKTMFSLLNMLLIIVALILIGNRSGLIVLFFSIFVWVILNWRSPWKKPALVSLTLITVLSLSIFGYILLDFIRSVESINISQSDLGSRLGSLGTYTERIIGRQNASDNLSFFGMGLGSSGLAASTLANKGLNYEAANSDIYAHDLVGEVMLDFGVVGLIVFAALIWPLFKRSLDTKEYWPYLALVLGSVLASSMLGGSFTYGRAGYFVFLFAGFLINKIPVEIKQRVGPSYG